MMMQQINFQGTIDSSFYTIIWYLLTTYESDKNVKDAVVKEKRKKKQKKWNDLVA
jgi:hypothetical protein